MPAPSLETRSHYTALSTQSGTVLRSVQDGSVPTPSPLPHRPCSEAAVVLESQPSSDGALWPGSSLCFPGPVSPQGAAQGRQAAGPAAPESPGTPGGQPGPPRTEVCVSQALASVPGWSMGPFPKGTAGLSDPLRGRGGRLQRKWLSPGGLSRAAWLARTPVWAGSEVLRRTSEAPARVREWGASGILPSALGQWRNGLLGTCAWWGRDLWGSLMCLGRAQLL